MTTGFDGRSMSRPEHGDFTHFWRVRTRFPDRHGQPCRVLARGRMNSILVEFGDGHRVLTSRNYVRRLT